MRPWGRPETVAAPGGPAAMEEGEYPDPCRTRKSSPPSPEGTAVQSVGEEDAAVPPGATRRGGGGRGEQIPRGPRLFSYCLPL